MRREGGWELAIVCSHWDMQGLRSQQSTSRHLHVNRIPGACLDGQDEGTGDKVAPDRAALRARRRRRLRQILWQSSLSRKNASQQFGVVAGNPEGAAKGV